MRQRNEEIAFSCFYSDKNALRTLAKVKPNQNFVLLLSETFLRLSVKRKSSILLFFTDEPFAPQLLVALLPAGS